MSRDAEHDRAEPADIEIGASVRADSVRFESVPDVEVRFGAGEGSSRSERVNLPDEVEPGVTYRDVSVRWRATARLDRARGDSGQLGGH
jgi:hypothetical protein